MRTKLAFIVLLSTLLAVPTANAWINQDNVQILRLIQFEGGIYRDYTLVEFSGGARCRVLHADRELLALTMSLYMAGKTVSAVCYDLQDDPGGSAFPSHKLHRIVGN